MGGNSPAWKERNDEKKTEESSESSTTTSTDVISNRASTTDDVPAPVAASKSDACNKLSIPASSSGCARDAIGKWALDTRMPSGHRVFNLELRPNGVAISIDPSYEIRGDWDVQGDRIQFRFNDGYVCYVAPCSGAANIKGQAHNVVNETWDWYAKRI